MKASAPQNKQLTRFRGMTLLELTVVILVILTLISIIFIGVNGWKNGANRTSCIMNIRNVQVAVRGYCNVNSHAPGTSLTGITFKDEIIGPGKLLSDDPACPSLGSYTFGENDIPDVGELYMSCSLSSTAEHIPPNIEGW